MEKRAHISCMNNRQFVAIHMMSALVRSYENGNAIPPPKVIALRAVEYADALISELEHE